MRASARPEMSVVPARVGLDFDSFPHIPVRGGEISPMCTAAVPASAGEVLRMLPSLLRVLAGADPAGQPADLMAEALRMLEQADAVGAAVRGRYLAAFEAQDGPLGDGQRTARTWLVHCTGVT